VNGPYGGTVDSSGNILIADTTNCRARVVAGSTGAFYGVAMAPGDIYPVAGNGTNGYPGDEGAATSAELYEASGVALDGAGELLIADFGTPVFGW
jgi:hypothetical protein